MALNKVNFSQIEEREPVPGFHGRFFHAENMTIANWRIERGSSIPEHSHIHRQIVLVSEGQFELTVDGDKMVLAAGDSVEIPPNVPHAGTAITNCQSAGHFHSGTGRFQITRSGGEHKKSNSENTLKEHDMSTDRREQNPLSYLGINNPVVHANLLPEELIEHALAAGQGVLSDTGAICVLTGKFTGRAPKDRFIVEDETSSGSVDWNAINQPISPRVYANLKSKLLNYLDNCDAVYMKDLYACADESYRLNIRVITEYPWSAHFADNMFIRPEASEYSDFRPDWTVASAPGFHAIVGEDGTPRSNFAIVNFTERMIIIGGTGYTGEIKKGIFAVLNYLLPTEHDVLAMHCSANVGEQGDTAIFFGLSGTGKTTLSADPERGLIGDDEHGWSPEGVFNFEGGSYAKTIDLTEEKEPDIYRAIRHGAILENIRFFPGTRTPDYEDASITQNTRVSYPIHHIDNALPVSIAGHPRNIFFLTADAFGVFPPISKLTPGQAMYHFLSGYTAKVAGTEEGVVDPEATFSTCFGAPFMPLHPTVYAGLLGRKMREHNTNVWLVNTGWTGGPFGIGSRIKLAYTRAMIHAALEGKLDHVEFDRHAILQLDIPTTCPGVPDEILNPASTWDDRDAYEAKARELAELFITNFEQFESEATEEMLEGAPMAGVTSG